MSMIHEITGDLPRYKHKQRKGRGESSGRGKTCGRGNKGSKARVGTTYKPTYEGGQTEIFRRFPKRGFSNENFERRYYIVNLSELDQFDNGATVDAVLLQEKGLVPDLKLPVKILGDGAISKKLTIVAGWYTKSAHQKIAEAGGVAHNPKGEVFEFPKPKKKFVPRDPVKKIKKADEPAEGEKTAASAKADAKPAEATEAKPANPEKAE